MVYQLLWVIYCQNFGEEQCWYYLTSSWDDKEVSNFAKGIECNSITRFHLTYNYITIKHIRYENSLFTI